MAHYTVTLKSDKPIPQLAINVLRHHALGVRDAHSLTMTEEVVGPSFTAKIRQDGDPENPRIDRDNADVMFCKHGRYILGDKDAEDPLVDVEVLKFDGYTLSQEEVASASDALSDLLESNDAQVGLWAKCLLVDMEAAEWVFTKQLRSNIALCLPLSLYDHSGITIFHGAPTCRWDSGQVGWHYITKEALQREWNGDLDAAKKYMEATLWEYDQYLRGNVWGFEIENEEGETVDSCGGFIGDDLDKTGMLDHVAKEHQQLLRDAWERRFG